MAPPRAKKSHDVENAPRQPRTSLKNGKLTAFNAFLKNELARLQKESPELTHQERFKIATANWKQAKNTPTP
ncbi:hypothetical protein PUR61_01030 [Streptomyces sp. BE20]|uniref:hypothetical protein n=1 Tax=unclassified Streptomyces TaxID=2593676 RepID=UPI002E79D7BA|nr:MULTISPECIES: hypothetical protein [unclassified Streptomyces]MED7947401.1 hypothetical protein [Streptomyces sp. BE303]MEE1820794.1 hypothetical protein [Streptomyces sp. BE20]